MEKIDFRTLPENERFALRKTAMKMLKAGQKGKDVAAILGLRPATISAWNRAYKENGIAALKGKTPGVKISSTKILSDEEEVELQKMIVDKMPDQIKLPFALWTCKAVQELVCIKFNKKIARTTMGEYLRGWGFTPQKPKKMAYERNDTKVDKWINEEYPQIKARAKSENGEIHWGDETGVRNNCNHGRSYSPKGKTPIKKSMAKRLSINMISTVTNQGATHFMAYTETMNSDMLIKFLKQLIKINDKKIFLVLDNLRVHHSKLVKAWLSENTAQIEVFYLPAYSPDLNPDEYLNCDLKSALSHMPSPKTKEELSINLEKHMMLLQNSPERVKKYFNHLSIIYAA